MSLCRPFFLIYRVYIRRYSVWLLSYFLLSVFSASIYANESKLDEGFSVTHKTQKMGQNSQKKIDRLAVQSRELFHQYQQLLNQAQYQQAYNEELAKLETQQTAEIKALKQQIADIKITQQQLTPLLREMVDTLAIFIQLDLPFERKQRLESTDELLILLDSSQSNTAEKFRRVMELYQAENDYNYDMQVYRESVTYEGKPLSVQTLRIGRSMLYFQSTDGKRSALWDKKTQQWQLMDNRYNTYIAKAIRVASKQSAPELLSLPIPVIQNDLTQTIPFDAMEVK